MGEIAHQDERGMIATASFALIPPGKPASRQLGEKSPNR
jgi:hypothetical protein